MTTLQSQFNLFGSALMSRAEAPIPTTLHGGEELSQPITLDELMRQLNEAAQGCFDEKVPVSEFYLMDDGETLSIDSYGQFRLNLIAKQSLAARFDLPYKKLWQDWSNDDARLLAQRCNTVNNEIYRITQGRSDAEWFCRFREVGEAFNLRVVLSSAYTPADNLPVLTTVLDSVEEAGYGGSTLSDALVTDSVLWARFAIPGFTRDLRPGETWTGAIRISNSEVGTKAAAVYAHLCRTNELGEALPGLSFSGTLKRAGWERHAGTTTERILARLQKNVPEVLDQLDGYFAKLAEFKDLPIHDPHKAVQTIAREHRVPDRLVQLAQTALVDAGFPPESVSTGYDVIMAFLKAAEGAKDFEEQFYVESLLGYMVKASRLR